MLGKKGWLGRHYVSEFPLQRRDDPGMNLLSATLQQGAISRVLNKGVFERVLRVWGCSTPKNQLGTYELIHGAIELLFGHDRDGADQFMRELTPECCRDLSHFAHRG